MNIRKWLVIYLCNMHCRLSKIYLLVLFMDNFQTQQFLTHSIYVKKSIHQRMLLYLPADTICTTMCKHIN